jgi:hypothetical protein
MEKNLTLLNNTVNVSDTFGSSFNQGSRDNLQNIREKFKPGTIGWNSNPDHYQNMVVEMITQPAQDDKEFDKLYSYRRMYKDGGKFRPKHTMPGIAPCVIHTEHPGVSAEERKQTLKESRYISVGRTTNYDYGIFANKQSQRTATLGGLAKTYDAQLPKD